MIKRNDEPSVWLMMLILNVSFRNFKQLLLIKYLLVYL